MTLTAGEAAQSIPRVAMGSGGSASVEDIGAAMSQVATLRGQIGAFQSNTIEPMIRSNSVAFENTAAARSAIRDTDYAAESSRLARGQALRQSSMWALMQANSSPRSVLGLLG
jgi:flagellin